MTVTAKQTWSLRDSRGMTATISMWYTTDTADHAVTLIAPITTALQDLTNAHIEVVRGGSTLTPDFGYGDDAQYAPIEDKASLTFVTAHLTRHVVRIPAPKATLFEADEQTVDPADTLVVAFRDAVLATPTGAFMSNSSGQALTGLIGGVRTRSKLRRRMSIFTLNPEETGPGE